MAPARRRAAAKNGAAAKKASPEPPAEVTLPRRSASARNGAAQQKKQQPATSRASRAKKAAADDSESELSELDEEQEEELEQEAQQDDEPDQHAGPSTAAAQHDGPLVQLQFKESLAWRPGRPIPTEELIRRLEALSQELSDLDQETFDAESLAKVAKELANQNLLGHKDKGVKAYAAACLVDILCLCAPNAPFTEKSLKDVFALFIGSILPALQDPSNTYDAQHKYVLHSLGEVRSILLLNDLDNSENLQLQLFTSLFDAVSAPKNVSGGRLPTDVEHDITEILICLIEEGTTVPPKVVDVIMAQFLRAAPPGALRGKGVPDKDELDRYQSTLLLKEEPPAYQMAKLICLTCADKMTRSVAQYFSDVIIDFSGVNGGKKGGKDDDDEGEEDEGQSGPSETDLREMKKAHLLLRELWRAAPQVLSNVVPQLEAELSADNVYLRQLASETLGDMISGIGAAGPPPIPSIDPAAYPPPRLSDELPASASDSVLTTPTSPHSFAQTHPHVYQSFINRKNDKAALIRTVWVSAAGYILSTSAGGIGLSREEENILVLGLGDKLSDSDEKVRLAAVKAIECFSFRDVITKLAPHGGVTKSGSVLSNLADRCRDRKSHVRVEAMALLGKLWAAATGELAAGDESVTAALGAVPSRIFSTIYASDLELNLLVDRITYEYLVPLSYPAVKKAQKAANGRGQQQKSAGAASGLDVDAVRAERILLLVRSLDASSKRAFFALQSRQPQFSKVVDGFLKQCESYNGGVGDDAKKVAPNLEKSIQYLCQFFPDAPKVQSDLQRFSKMNDRRSYQLVRFVTGPEHDFTTMYRAMKELVKKVQATNSSGILDTLLPLLYRSGCIMFNRSHLTTIMEFSKAGHEDMAATANEMLKEVSQRNPGLFKTTIGELCKELASQAPTESRDNDPIVIDSLKACSSYAAKYPQEVPRERKFVQAWINFAVYGRPEKAAKYAVNILLATKDETSMVNATELAQKVTKDFTLEASRFLNKLVACSQLARYAPSVISEADDELRKQAMSILRTASKRAPADTAAAEWVDDANFDDTGKAKVWSLNLLVQQLLGTKDAETARADAKNIMAYLIKVIVQDGETRKTEKDTPESHKARLRLGAAQAILKICADRQFDDVLSHADFNKLALVTQDKQPQVRRGFIEKLQKYLVLGKLRPRFYTIIFLAAFEPVTDFRGQIETWIRSRTRHFQGAKQHVLEGVIARLISLLAHHPDYRNDADDLVDHARYIVFYLSSVATESSLGLINKYAERVKQTLDGIDADHSESLYVLSDLTQATIRKFQQRKGWTLEPYAEKVGVPQGLYAPLPSHEKALEIARKQFLPEGIEERLDELLKVAERKKKRRSAEESHQSTSNVHAPKKAKTASRSGATTKRSSKPKSKSSLSLSSTRVPDSERRRSGRGGGRTQSSYMERDSDEDDEEMLDGVAEWQYVDSDEEDGEEGDGGRRRSSAAKRSSRGGGEDGIYGRSRQVSDSGDAGSDGEE